MRSDLEDVRWARTYGDRSADHAECRNDRGFTLVELLIAIVLLATAIAALLVAWNQNIQASVKHRDQSETQTKVVSAANWIASNDITFVSCASQTNPGANPSVDVQQLYNVGFGGPDEGLGNLSYGAAPWRPDLIVVSKPVEFWDSVSETWVTASTLGECPVPASPLQRVTIRVTHPSGSTSTEIEVVKSDVWSS